ncbi:GNAT family N-acetyltransferase [Brachybacterium sp. EF45031]|uniref:GNAT family N-acetyltransferase n=1 Tax=Brachybacterium sillae TaxID=2810536 RepID=UPI00217D7117|nr:GNAT family N-acetyltransferase [Brachybacterium sillae]MCS6712514.1 GNAT family N-acetyltransferase [Brachybacterium sillae]
MPTTPDTSDARSAAEHDVTEPPAPRSHRAAADRPEAGEPSLVEHRARVGDIDPVTLYRLLRLRQDVFVTEQQVTDPDLDGRDLEDGSELLWISAGGEPVAHLRILEGPGEQVRIGRVATRADHRHQGLARRLMGLALERARERHPQWPVEIDAQAYLEDWYAAQGFVRHGEVFLEASLEHVAMTYQHPGTPPR